jgi:rhamnulokinase
VTASQPQTAPVVTLAAVDLGATSGRVMVGRLCRGELGVTEVHRFPNLPVRLPTGLHWDVPGLFRSILEGLGKAARQGPVDSLGVDTWAVDYGLLDADGALLGLPYHYRDERTSAVAARVRDEIGAEHLYHVNGLQHLPFNTLFQLAAARQSAQLSAAETLLLIPDLISYWLTGETGAEITNASTTGLLDAGSGTWSRSLAERVGLDPRILPALREPGSRAGELLPYVRETTGLGPRTAVVTVASHDTASAVVAIPSAAPHPAFISCGTWSLAGIELDAPVLSQESRAANFTNEAGIDGTVRYLRNVMGMWLLEECRSSWRTQGLQAGVEDLLHDAARATPFASVIDPDDPGFLAPADMPTAIAEYCVRTGQRPPEDRGAHVRCILESLALAHRRVLRQAARLSGREITRVHMVGGGSRNELLCQFTADATGLPVIAGPAEATALGNILVQARVHGAVTDLPSMRALVASTQPLRTYEPTRGIRSWDAVAARFGID